MPKNSAFERKEICMNGMSLMVYLGAVLYAAFLMAYNCMMIFVQDKKVTDATIVVGTVLVLFLLCVYKEENKPHFMQQYEGILFGLMLAIDIINVDVFSFWIFLGVQFAFLYACFLKGSMRKRTGLQLLWTETIVWEILSIVFSIFDEKGAIYAQRVFRFYMPDVLLLFLCLAFIFRERLAKKEVVIREKLVKVFRWGALLLCTAGFLLSFFISIMEKYAGRLMRFESWMVFSHSGETIWGLKNYYGKMVAFGGIAFTGIVSILLLALVYRKKRFTEYLWYVPVLLGMYSIVFCNALMFIAALAALGCAVVMTKCEAMLQIRFRMLDWQKNYYLISLAIFSFVLVTVYWSAKMIDDRNERLYPSVTITGRELANNKEDMHGLTTMYDENNQVVFVCEGKKPTIQIEYEKYGIQRKPYNVDVYLEEAEPVGEKMVVKGIETGKTKSRLVRIVRNNLGLGFLKGEDTGISIQFTKKQHNLRISQIIINDYSMMKTGEAITGPFSKIVYILVFLVFGHVVIEALWRYVRYTHALEAYCKEKEQ